MSTLPTRFAIAVTALLSRTSSRDVSAIPSLASGAIPFSSISVANTVAPSRAKAIAQARPIPAAPAVTNARLPLRRSPMQISLSFDQLLKRHGEERSDEAIQTVSAVEFLDCFAALAMTALANDYPAPRRPCRRCRDS